MVSHIKVGSVLVTQGDSAGALKAYREGLAIAQQLAMADPTNTEWQRDLAVSHNNVGNVLVAQGDVTGALKAYRESLAIRRRLASADPNNATWQRDLAVLHYNLGTICMNNGDVSEAQEHDLQCRDLFRRMKGRGMHLDAQAETIFQQLESQP